jgi:hypothetical protein
MSADAFWAKRFFVGIDVAVNSTKQFDQSDTVEM